MSAGISHDFFVAVYLEYIIIAALSQEIYLISIKLYTPLS